METKLKFEFMIKSNWGLFGNQLSYANVCGLSVI